jgi:hypothetical protein
MAGFDLATEAVTELRKVDPFQLPKEVPLAALILAALRHCTPLPPELWRRVGFTA